MNRPYVLSIAGLDPSGGAGILADCKTFESAEVQGFGVATSLTYQNESNFIGLHWVSVERIIAQIDPLIDLYSISVIKIGLIENPLVLKGVIAHVRQRINDVKIVWDPILKASAGFDFHKNGLESFINLLKDIDVITPNWKELKYSETSPLEIAMQLSQHCAVVLKGGHSDEERANDYLVVNGELQSFSFPRLGNVSKHGTGCMFSSSIAAHLALKDSLAESVLAAKTFVFERLQSQEGGLASF